MKMMGDYSSQNLLKRYSRKYAGIESKPSAICHKIDEKEKELECPVCMETASVPMFTCSYQHMICGCCRPQVTSYIPSLLLPGYRVSVLPQEARGSRGDIGLVYHYRT